MFSSICIQSFDFSKAFPFDTFLWGFVVFLTFLERFLKKIWFLQADWNRVEKTLGLFHISRNTWFPLHLLGYGLLSQSCFLLNKTYLIASNNFSPWSSRSVILILSFYAKSAFGTGFLRRWRSLLNKTKWFNSSIKMSGDCLFFQREKRWL